MSYISVWREGIGLLYKKNAQTCTWSNLIFVSKKKIAEWDTVHWFADEWLYTTRGDSPTPSHHHFSSQRKKSFKPHRRRDLTHRRRRDLHFSRMALAGRRDGPLMLRGGGGGKPLSRGSRIAVAVAIGITLGCVCAFLYPAGLFRPSASALRWSRHVLLSHSLFLVFFIICPASG